MAEGGKGGRGCETGGGGRGRWRKDNMKHLPREGKGRLHANMRGRLSEGTTERTRGKEKEERSGSVVVKVWEYTDSSHKIHTYRKTEA